jgi:glutamyl-tRNA reductase
VNPTSSAPIVVLTAHARSVPAAEREAFAQRLRRKPGPAGLVLETCHRVEAYAIDRGDDGANMAATFGLPGGGRVMTGRAAVRHAVTVAVGRDSVVVGEDQILHQLRATVDAVRSDDRLDPTLERLFAVALRAGRVGRSWRQGAPRSLADLAMSAIERQVGPLAARDVLVVGAGRMGRLAARAAVATGASVAVANRSAERAAALASTVSARIEPFDPRRRAGGFQGIIVALGGPWPVSAATIQSLVDSPTVVVDLSVPEAVPAELSRLLGPRLVTADALALAESEPDPGHPSVDRLEVLIDRTTDDFLAWHERRAGRKTAEALVERSNREREAELAALWRQLPDLEPKARDAIEGMTRHLAERLLREPLERLGRDTDGRDERVVRDIFAL